MFVLTWCFCCQHSIFGVYCLLLFLINTVADTGGLQWFQLKPPLKICIQLTSGWVGDTFVVMVQVKGFRRLLSTDKQQK